MQIAAMDNGVWISEPLAKWLVEGNADDFLASHCVRQPKLINEHSHRTSRVADAQVIKRVKRIRPQLDARSDLPEP